ncbi:MAG: hypothetical protein NVS3B18_04170 [Candidatus Dormibacteria bacterium]
MGMLSRLFRSREPAASAVPASAVVESGPTRHTVLVPDDLVGQLTADGEPLQEAVERALRRALEPARTAEVKPFWVQRGEAAGDLSDELRDRVAQRRAAETES